ncbi:hypothetical protein C2845_PM13G02960 [Panicum miliaceum]|uniref:Uncharacterized protein n=1 Tax=Panicum miliaceum TaxID=4540 RepID=A0A3L6RFW0_PANMI|nr:hypothetical protein C2845_PM13G02960 [Panicum miliaceum]
MTVFGHLPLAHLLPYMTAQVLGSIAASFTVKGIYHPVNPGITTVPNVGTVEAFFLEFIMTFVLLFIITALPTDPHAVGVFIKDPLENSMVTFNFTSVVPPMGTTFIFGSWVRISDGIGDFRRHLVDDKLEARAATPSNTLNDFVDNLDDIAGMLLPDLAREIEKLSVFDVTPTRAAPGFPGLDSTPSGGQRDRLPFGLRNTATVYQEATKSEFYSALEKDLDELLELGDKAATACREAPIFDDYDSDSGPEAEPYSGGQGLVITSTSEGRFVYWKGMKPSELLGDDERLVAH